MDKWQDMRNELHTISSNFEFVNNIAETIKIYPHFNLDCLSKGQLLSKKWAVDELKDIISNTGTIYLLGGWYAIIAEMLFENIDVQYIRSYDIDPTCTPIADELNISHVIDSWRFKSFIDDINKIDYTNVDVIINTSCEHIKSNEWFDRIPDGVIVLLQSNDTVIIEDHVNCVISLEEMKNKYEMKTILYSGKLDVIDYTRFMIIGVK